MLAILFIVPFPYTATEIYMDKEPYEAQEPYTEMVPYMATEAYTEQVPMTVEGCKTDISTNPMDYLNRGIQNLDELLKGNINKLLETCKDVVRLREVQKSREVVKYKTETRYRPVIKYKDVEKTRTVTRSAILFQQWTGQVQYQYRV